MRQRCEVHQPGPMDYRAAWSWQQRLHAAVQAGEAPHQLLLLEHPPAITLGRSGRAEHLLAAPDALAARGIETIRVDRGGDITYHGPGQLVGYPIVDLRALWGAADVPRYVRTLERVISGVLAGYGIDAGCRAGYPGVWVAGDKIAAIGVRVSRGVSMHGFALNITTDLASFDLIVPCGIREGGVTSMERLLGDAPPFAAVATAVADAFAAEFGVSIAEAAVPA